MTAALVVGAFASISLAVYLTVALLKPEWFQ